MLKNIEQLKLDLGGMQDDLDNGVRNSMHCNAVVKWVEELESKFMRVYREIENLSYGEISMNSIDQYNDEKVELRNELAIIESIMLEELAELNDHVEILRQEDLDNHPARKLRRKLTIESFEDSIEKIVRIYGGIINLPM